MSESVSLTRYEAARAALADAVRVDEVQSVRTDALKIRAYAKIAKDKGLQADATVLILRAERKLGVLMISAKEIGQMGIGRPERSNLASGQNDDSDDAIEKNGSQAEPFIAEPAEPLRVTLKEAGIDKKLSMRAQKWARMGGPDFDAELQAQRDRIMASGAVDVSPINGARNVMGGRVESASSLDFFPTPPWATRALVEDVLPHLGVQLQGFSVEDPCCGEGHITGVLEEYGLDVAGYDIHDYSRDGRSAPGWQGERDFLGATGATTPDLIISNTPFGDAALRCALRALERAKVGVALFVRLQWLDGIDRYEQLFRDMPPTLIAQFVERVNLCKGRWDPEGSTATPYCFLVWIKGAEPRPMFWIPPGRRVERSLPTDVERFTAHPVISIRQDDPVDPAVDGPQTVDGRPVATEPETGSDQSAALGAGEGGDAALPALSVYEAALAAAAEHHGKHTQHTAEAIMRAGVAAGIPSSQIALDTDSKLGTVLGWKKRLNLTGLGTGRAAPRPRAEAVA